MRKHCSSVRQRLVAAQRRPQRPDALRRDDRNQPRLPRQRERALVTGRVGFADGGEGVVLVGDEEQVAPRRAADWRRSSGCAAGPRAENPASASRRVRGRAPGSWRPGNSGRARGRFRAGPRAAATGAARPVSAASMYAWRGGQNARWTAGFSSNSDRNTTMPSTMDALTFAIEPRPRVVEPALNRLETVTAIRADRGGAGADLERDACVRRDRLRAPHRTDAPRACRRAAPTASTAPAASAPGTLRAGWRGRRAGCRTALSACGCSSPISSSSMM